MTAAWVPPGPAWLFCPADRPERYQKAAAVADVVILDLEDGVAAADKDAARSALAANPLDPETTVVRVNPVQTPDLELDLAALENTGYRRLMLPKTETGEQVAALADFEVLALVESPLGVLAAERIARADNTIGLMWGAEDLVAGLGGTSSRRSDGAYRDVAKYLRSGTLVAAKAYGRLALDGVYLNIGDLDGLQAEAEDAVAVGFDVKVAIHPNQVPVIRAAYAPSGDEYTWAQAVLAEAAQHRGVFAFDGRMVDAPLLRHAEQIVRRGRAHGGTTA
ncbi:HpcH/HpaI aldolase/citrate lyase family protein [Nocardia donostiensis]|uniref:CoA ester lyase n=1 Tax=Nocardia donostiensis TaxID=1538463 RepID=A0A1W0AYC6_9NOCA|nr:CoA ester lyase [Nocardia donostiensis]ONM47088.1 CoA ester lyase [Nocardia donostiensis]OQS15241.1 CoA ester lyase [Nocardia donostiensis]OQS20073.1 CoA ester lyase [Nocardia donostiensis]